MHRSEKSIEQSVIAQAKKLGVKLALKLEPKGMAGFPDRLFLLPGGIAFFVEFKRLNEKPRPLQEFRIQQLRDLGYHAIWADNADDAIQAIRGALGSASWAKEGGKVPP